MAQYLSWELVGFGVDPAQDEVRLIPAARIAAETLPGCTVVEVGDDVTLAGKVPDFDTLTLVDAPVPVPARVTPLQMRKAIRAAGKSADVAAFIETLRGTEEGDAAIEAWDFAIEIRRDDPFIAMALAGLGWDGDQADDLFRLAATF